MSAADGYATRPNLLPALLNSVCADERLLAFHRFRAASLCADAERFGGFNVGRALSAVEYVAELEKGLGKSRALLTAYLSNGAASAAPENRA